MTDIPDPETLTSAEQSNELDLETRVADILERAEEKESKQIRSELIKPLFDMIDRAVAKGEIIDAATGEPYTTAAIRERFGELVRNFRDPRQETEPDVDPLAPVPEAAGLRKAIDGLLLDSLTEGVTMQEMAERYEKGEELAEIQEDLGEAAVESPLITEDGRNLEEAQVYSREEMRELREAARRINESIAEVQEEINSLIGRFSASEQRALHLYAEGMNERNQQKVNEAWEGISTPVKLGEGDILTQIEALYRKKADIDNS